MNAPPSTIPTDAPITTRASIRLILLIGASLLAAIVAVGGYTAQRQLERMRADLIDHARSDARQIATMTADWLLLRDLANIESMLVDMVSAPHINGAMVTDDTGRVLIRVAQEAGARPRAVYREHSLSPPDRDRETVEVQDEEVAVWQPVGTGTRIGWVRVRYSLQSADRERRAIWRHTAIASGVALSVTLLLLMIVLRRPLRALAESARFARALGSRHGRQRPILGTTAELVELQQALNDVSVELHDQDRRLAERERMLATLVGNLPGMVYRCRNDRDWTLEFTSQGALGLTGYHPAELVGPQPAIAYGDLIHPDDRERVWLAVQEAVAARRGFQLRYRLRSRDDEEREAWEQGCGVYSSDGKLLALEGYVLDVTATARADAALREQERRMRALFEALPDLLFRMRGDGTYLDFKPARDFPTYVPPEVFLGRKPSDVLPAPVAEKHMRLIARALETGEAQTDRYRLDRGDGERDFEARIVPSGPDEVLVTVRDITEQRRREGTIIRLGRIVDASSNEIYVFEAGSLRFVQVNEGARRNLGYSPEELRALTPLDLKPEFTPESFAELRAPLERGEQELVTFVTRHRRKDGSLYPVEIRLQLSRAEQPPVYVAMVQDITDRQHTEQRLHSLAYYDTLTGLPNRALLRDRMRQAMLDADRRQHMVAILFLDLDRFKLINDSLGHAVGDGLLKAAAERLRGAVRSGDTIARLGGDEFTVVLPDIDHIDHVLRVAQKLNEQFAQPFHVDGHELYTTASFGITLYPWDDGDIDALLKNADAAMYHAKESGRGTFKFYTAELNTRARRQLELETGLRQALERDQFVLRYQPIVELAGRRIIGAEALIRWQHPEFGLVPPADFIPLAEETGLIVPIGEWVLEHACRQARAWRDAGLPALRLAVNLSSRQFQEGRLTETVREALAASGLEPDLLELELTESLLMRDPERTVAIMQDIKQLGVRFSMDDFGTGYSSLAYLKRFPIDTLKIDRSFVRDLLTDPNDAVITEATIAMAHTMDIRVVAEGVETAAQFEFLRARGCDEVQGYYCSAPLAAERFGELLGSGPTFSEYGASAPGDRNPD